MMRVLALVSLGLVGCIARASSDELGDNLWMWGHDTGHYDGPVNYARHDYKIPWSAPITMPRGDKRGIKVAGTCGRV